MKMKPCIVIHGGAALIPENKIECKIDGIKAAVSKGYEVLCRQGGTALDAVEAAVFFMEDNPFFNAGYGSCLTNEGTVEMDAIIMDGRTMNAGAVAGISKIKNPVSLSRKILENSDHVLLIGEGAHQLASSWNIPLINNEELITEWSTERLHQYRTFKNALEKNMKVSEHDTVGAVAVDALGNVACATSTGGITAKLVGRVGDSPLVGSGGLADNFTGAVSTTGHGEAIMRVCLSSRILSFMENGKSAQEAADAGIQYMKERIGGTGGAIVVDPQGNIGIQYSTEHMIWAHRNQETYQFSYKPHNIFISEILEA